MKPKLLQFITVAIFCTTVNFQLCAASPADLVQPHCIWSTADGDTLTILERSGDRFHARYVRLDSIREISGTVRGDKISWLAKNVTVVKGTSGHDISGKINGTNLELNYSGGLEGGNGHSGSLAPMTLVSTPVAGNKTAPVQIESNPSQPRVDVLCDQAPNAIEWGLAPLERAVPGDIRQNITFLREDLLTETQDQPKLTATRDAAVKLCDAIIGVLDERKLTLAKAGFRAVEARARTGVTSQALEARRNYKMSWPQFAREESQRAELKSQAIGNAQVIAERPKLDWAQRTAALQKPLDDFYRQYCEALRQSAK